MKAIYTLFLVFYKLCIFRNKPQDLPRSIELLLLCILTYTVINFLLSLNLVDAGHAMLSSLLETLLICLITFFLLMLSKKTERYIKTLMAIAGTGCIIGIIALPLFYLAFSTDGGVVMQSLTSLAYLSLLIWNTVIMGNILRYSLETTLGTGIIFAVIYIIITSMLINQLLPAVEPA